MSIQNLGARLRLSLAFIGMEGGEDDSINLLRNPQKRRYLHVHMDGKQEVTIANSAKFQWSFGGIPLFLWPFFTFEFAKVGHILSRHQ